MYRFFLHNLEVLRVNFISDSIIYFMIYSFVFRYTYFNDDIHL